MAVKHIRRQVPGTVEANKALVVGADKQLDELHLAALFMGSGAGEAMTGGSLATGAGVGITGGTGTVYRSSVQRVGGIIITRILIDLTGLNGGGTANDVIGTNGAGAAHLGQITAAQNGTIFGGLVTCLEVPTTSDPDVDLWSANEATGVEDTAISALTGEVQLTNGGDHTLARQIALIDVPAANQYLYLTGGDATAGTYDAGKFLIELFGYA